MKKNIYLLYGEEQYLVKKKRKEMYRNLYNDDINTSILTFTSEDEIIDLATSLPFFTEKRCIFVVDSGLLKTDSARLAKTIDEIPESTYLIFSEQDVDTKRKLFKKIKESGTVIKYPKQKPRETVGWITERFSDEGKMISKNVAELLYSHTGNDMQLIDNEIEKIICYVDAMNTIDKKDIEDIATVTLNDKVFAMIDFIAEGKKKQALDLYYNLLLLKEPASKILVLITKQFEKLLRLKAYSKNGIDEKTAMKKCEIQGFAMKKTIKQADSFSATNLGHMLKECSKTQAMIQNGAIDATLGTETLIIKLSRR